MVERTSRSGQSRSARTRASEQRAVPATHYQSRLYVPPHMIPKGFTYAWVREATLNEPDPDNVTDRLILGWKPVPATDHPEMVPPPLPGYEDQVPTIIRRGGLILCKRPTKDVVADRRLMEHENIQMLQDVAWTGQEDPNLPRFNSGDTSAQFERVTAFRD